MQEILIGLAVAVGVLALAAIGYIAYLFIDYHRLEDELPLTVDQSAAGSLRPGEELGIVSWNIGFGAYSAGFSFFMDGGDRSRAESSQAVRKNMASVTDELRRQKADFMLIQEADVRSHRACGVNLARIIREAFAHHSAVFAQNYDSSYLFYPFTKPIGAARSGILTLVRARIDSAMRFSLPIERGLRRFLDLDRCYSLSRIPAGERELCLYNLHLSAYTADGSIATEQLDILLRDMRRERAAGNYVIAGGDFNKDLWGNSARITGISGGDYSWARPFPADHLPQGFTLADSLSPARPVLSCRDTGAPYVKGRSFEVTLDGFIVSDNVEIVGCEVIDTGFIATDHNPVRMRFRLRA